MARLLAHNVEGTRFKNTSAASHMQPPNSPLRYNTAMSWQQAKNEKYEGRMAIWKVQPGHQSKRGLTEQKQTKENATFELKRFSNRSFSKRSQRAQSTQGSKGHARFNLQSQEGPSANQQRVKRSSSFFAPPVPIVTIVAAGVLPAGHRGLPVGAWPQSTFGATVTTQLSQVYVWHSGGI